MAIISYAPLVGKGRIRSSRGQWAAAPLLGYRTLVGGRPTPNCMLLVRILTYTHVDSHKWIYSISAGFCWPWQPPIPHQKKKNTSPMVVCTIAFITTIITTTITNTTASTTALHHRPPLPPSTHYCHRHHHHHLAAHHHHSYCPPRITTTTTTTITYTTPSFSLPS